MAYLITYDLNKPGQDYTKLYEAIKALSGTHWHMMESVWITAHPGPAKTIRDTLTPFLDANDKLLVVKCGPEGAWKGFNKECSDWLINNL